MKKYLYISFKSLIFILLVFTVLIIFKNNDSYIKNPEYNIECKEEYNNNHNDEKYNETLNNKIYNINDWKLRIVNKYNPLPEGFQVELEKINNSYSFDKRSINDLKNMINSANKDGINLFITSAYRSIDNQTILFNNNIKKLMNNNSMTKDEAILETSMNIAFPGTSEHNLALALDIVSNDWFIKNDDLYEHFDQTKEYEWLNNNAHKFGFIERYPKNKTNITNIVYEPWHYRYVSTEHSIIIKEKNICLEEYINYYYKK